MKHIWKAIHFLEINRIKVLLFCDLEQVKEKVLSRTEELDINFKQQIRKKANYSDQILCAINHVPSPCTL